MIQRHNSDLDIGEGFTRESNRLPERDLDRVANAYRELLQSIGEDVNREGLQRTPGRAARALEFLTQGYRQNLDEIINGAVFESGASEIILVKDIELYSVCEHHLLPFIGKAHVAYLPAGKIVGLSKLARVVEVLSRRPQVQERMTEELADLLMRELDARGVAVVLEATHTCMTIRGIRKANSICTTSAMRGAFALKESTRAELMALIYGSR